MALGCDVAVLVADSSYKALTLSVSIFTVSCKLVTSFFTVSSRLETTDLNFTRAWIKSSLSTRRPYSASSPALCDNKCPLGALYTLLSLLSIILFTSEWPRMYTTDAIVSIFRLLYSSLFCNAVNRSHNLSLSGCRVAIIFTRLLSSNSVSCCYMKSCNSVASNS